MGDGVAVRAPLDINPELETTASKGIGREHLALRDVLQDTAPMAMLMTRVMITRW